MKRSEKLKDIKKQLEAAKSSLKDFKLDESCTQEKLSSSSIGVGVELREVIDFSCVWLPDLSKRAAKYSSEVDEITDRLRAALNNSPEAIDFSVALQNWNFLLITLALKLSEDIKWLECEIKVTEEKASIAEGQSIIGGIGQPQQTPPQDMVNDRLDDLTLLEKIINNTQGEKEKETAIMQCLQAIDELKEKNKPSKKNRKAIRAIFAINDRTLKKLEARLNSTLGKYTERTGDAISPTLLKLIKGFFIQGQGLKIQRLINNIENNIFLTF